MEQMQNVIQGIWQWVSNVIAWFWNLVSGLGIISAVIIPICAFFIIWLFLIHEK